MSKKPRKRKVLTRMDYILFWKMHDTDEYVYHTINKRINKELTMYR